jgi:hypothetical protein
LFYNPLFVPRETCDSECRDGVLAHRHDRGERDGLRRSPQGSDDCRPVLGNDC